MCLNNTYSYVWLDNKLTPIDSCIVGLILQLNQVDIKTRESCCGHGRGHPNVLCEKGTKEKLREFGCPIVVTRQDGLVEAYFPVCNSGKVYPYQYKEED